MFNQLLLNGIIAGSIYALIALGFTVIYKTVRFFHFAHGVVYTAGAYFAYSLSMSFGVNPTLSFFLIILKFKSDWIKTKLAILPLLTKTENFLFCFFEKFSSNFLHSPDMLSISALFIKLQSSFLVFFSFKKVDLINLIIRFNAQILIILLLTPLNQLPS